MSAVSSSFFRLIRESKYDEAKPLLDQSLQNKITSFFEETLRDKKDNQRFFRVFKVAEMMSAKGLQTPYSTACKAIFYLNKTNRAAASNTLRKEPLDPHFVSSCVDVYKNSQKELSQLFQTLSTFMADRKENFTATPENASLPPRLPTPRPESPA